MSDSGTYEIGDLIWDEFCMNEDHIVPHSSGEEGSDHSFLVESRKKTYPSGNTREQSAKRSAYAEKTLESMSDFDDRRNMMLEKDSWSHQQNGMFPSLRDSKSAKGVPSLSSEGTRTSSHGIESSNTDLNGTDFCAAADSILVDKGTGEENNSYNYPLGNIPQTENDIAFFENNQNDKDSSDFLYYGWPDIGNFEDVDRMFRSCDSTFGLGSSNDDELAWLSSSNAIEGSESGLKSEIEHPFPASSEMENGSGKNDHLQSNDTCPSLNDSGVKSALGSCENDSWNMDDSVDLGQLSFADDMDIPNKKDNLRPRKQGFELKSEALQKISATNRLRNSSSGMINAHKKQQKQQGNSENKRKGLYMGHGGPFFYDDSFPSEMKDMPSEASSDQTPSLGGLSHQKQDLGSESFAYLQNNYHPYLQPDYSHPSEQTSTFPTISTIRSDSIGYMSIPSKESSYSSNQATSTLSSHSPAFQVTSALPLEKMEKLHPNLALGTMCSKKPNSGEIGVQVPVCDQVSVEKTVQNSIKQLQNHTNVEGPPGRFGLGGQESSSVSSGLDEISLEAKSFRQLQLVMEQLDMRTKLCIRDSLYRLARSAEQRHNQTYMKGSYCGDDRDASGELLGEGSNRCTGFVDMETDTNPIDRSVAHLLFHRPSDSSAMPGQDSIGNEVLSATHP